jgi:RNA polymerase sigma factor (sigma-70 family)
MDYLLPDGTGAEVAAAIRASRPDTTVVFLSADDSDAALMAAVEAGASGYLLKTAGGEDVVSAIRRAAEGEMLIPPGRLVDLFRSQRERTRRRAELQQVGDQLTTREREVLVLMAAGLGNREIADHLAIGYATVRSHVHSLLEKLGARSKLEAVFRAAELGLLTD